MFRMERDLWSHAGLGSGNGHSGLIGGETFGRSFCAGSGDPRTVSLVPLLRSPLRNSGFALIHVPSKSTALPKRASSGTRERLTVPLYAVKGFWKTVGPSCHCIGVLSDAVSSP